MPPDAFSETARAAAEALGWARERDALLNTLAMQNAERAKKEEAIRAATIKAIADGDLETLRKLASE